MKNILFATLLVCLGGSAMGQTPETEAAYKKDPKLPAFNLQLADSSWFTKADLPKTGYKYTIIVYFSPDCGHCQHEAKEITAHMDSLKNAFFVFVAYKPLDEIKGFAEYYGLDKFNNVKLGRDPKYYIPSFFRVTRTPFIVVYNQKGLLEKVYDPETTEVPGAEELVALVNKN
jgi:hypothetical protein